MGTVAGGASTVPLRTSNSAKWHGQTTAVFTSSLPASEQSSWLHVSSNAWKILLTVATATGRLSSLTWIICLVWMLCVFAMVTTRFMSAVLSFLRASYCDQRPSCLATRPGVHTFPSQDGDR